MEIRKLVPFMRFRVMGGWIPSQPHFVFSRNASDLNFEMVICYRRNFEKGSFDWKLNGLVEFLIVESD